MIKYTYQTNPKHVQLLFFFFFFLCPFWEECPFLLDLLRNTTLDDGALILYIHFCGRTTILNPPNFKARLVHLFKHMFSVFKQHYTYFHTFFNSHVFSKNTNNVTRTTLSNRPSVSWKCDTLKKILPLSHFVCPV